MDHYVNIYSHHADKYHPMIAVEDVDGQLKAALAAAVSPRGKRLIDLGTGTGRFPLWLAREAKSFVGLDLHWGMLKQNQIEREKVIGNWGLVNGDARALPFAAQQADVVLAGWAIGHLRGWYKEDWQQQIARVLREMRRVAVPHGLLVIAETLGTGSLTPGPPAPHLAEYYAWLENEWGFGRQEVATDYQFASVEEAVRQTEFFFGAEMAEKIRQNNWARLPEWTGLWTKRI